MRTTDEAYANMLARIACDRTAQDDLQRIGAGETYMCEGSIDFSHLSGSQAASWVRPAVEWDGPYYLCDACRAKLPES